MRAPPEVRLDRFERLIHQVSFESEKGGVIIVEGQRDRDSLRQLGIMGTILCLQSSRANTITFVEEMEDASRAIVLTDFDRQGVFLAKQLSRILMSQKIQANLVLWRDLRRLTRSDVRSIEELPKFYERLQSESGLLHMRRGYELPVLTRNPRVRDERLIRLSRQHKDRKKTRKARERMPEA